MNHILSKFVVIAALALPTGLAAQESEGRNLALLTFDSMDEAGRGYIDQGIFTAHGADIFVSMDYNEDDQISLKEFLNWDYGMLPVAQKADREDAYYTALRVVFAFWDRDGDNTISKTEYRKSMNRDFRRADTDDNALLTASEFTSGYSMMVALRAAINPAPAE